MRNRKLTLRAKIENMINPLFRLERRLRYAHRTCRREQEIEMLTYGTDTRKVDRFSAALQRGIMADICQVR